MFRKEELDVNQVMTRKTSIGFHTISIFARISRGVAVELLKLFGNIKDIRIKKTDYNPNYYEVYYVGKDRGVSFLIRFDEFDYNNKKGEKKQHRQYYLEAKINPKVIVGEDEYIVAANESYIEPMIRAYDSIVVNISPMIPLYHHCAFKEIHYCINFHLKELGYPYTAGQVMKLYKSGYIPYKYEELKKRCKISHHMKSLDHSFYLISNSVIVNCYDKQAQLKAFQNHLIEQQNQLKDKNTKKYLDLSYRIETLNSRIAKAEGILRFEIQFKYHKIQNAIKNIKDYMKKNNLLIDIRDYMEQDISNEIRTIFSLGITDLAKILLSDEMAKNVIYKYYSRILGLGDYHTLSGAKEEVREKCCSSKANRLITTLNFINKNKSHTIHNAKAILDAIVKAAKDSGDMDALENAKLDITIFCNSLRELNALKINPACISREDKIPFMPNLLRVYLGIPMNGISIEEMKVGVTQWSTPYFYEAIDI